MSIDRARRTGENRRMLDMDAILAGREPKQAAILAAAMQAFLRYGFRRSSMQDIARGAGMSRAALYLQFRNKDDVFGQLTQVFFDHACAVLADELRREGPLPQVMAHAFVAKAGPLMKALFASPHGAEFVEYKAGIGAEAMSAGDARIAEVLAHWLERATDAHRVVLEDTPEQTARVIAAALSGVHKSARDYDSYEAGVRQLGRMFGRALSP